MYSDDWRKLQFTREPKINVSACPDIRFSEWFDNKIRAGVCLDFEVADDFHIELLEEDWQKCLELILKPAKQESETDALKRYFAYNTHIWQLDDDLRQYNIPFEKIASY